MAIQNIIKKAEQEYPPIPQTDVSSPALSGYVEATFYPKSNPSGFVNSESPLLKGSKDVIYVDGAGSTEVNGIYIKTSPSPLTYTKYNSSSYRIILNTGIGPGFAWNIQEFFGVNAGWQERYRGGNSSLGHTSPLDFPEWSPGLGGYPGQGPSPRLYSYTSTFDTYYKPFREFALINGASNKLKFGITGGWDFFTSYTLSARPQNGTIALLSDVSGVINTTYSTLTGLKAANNLISGQLYRISDFHLTWRNQSLNDTGIKSGLSPEPLIVLALSSSGISHEAKSELYPQDTIYYDIDATSSNSWGAINNNTAIPNFKGWIYRRIDHKLNIDIPWDWRHITVNCCRPNMTSIGLYNPATNYSLYSVVKNVSNKLYYSIQNNNTNNSLTNTAWWSPVTSFIEGDTYFVTDESYGFRAYNKNGAFINLPADTSTRIQQPTFTSSLVSQGIFQLIDCNNIKINGGHSNVFLGSNIHSNTIGNNFNRNTIGSFFFSNTIGDESYLNNIGSSFNSNTIGNLFYYNTIGNQFNNNTIGNIFNSNTIANFSNSNTIGNYFHSNTIGNTFRSNTIGNSLYSNTIGNFFENNTIGNFFETNAVGSDFKNNTIGNYFFGNTIGESFSSNAIGNFLYSNTIGNGLYSNTIGNNFYSNTLGNNFNFNTIGNDFGSNTLGNNSFTSNTIGNYFDSNTIGNAFESNTIGSNFGSNTIGNSFNSNTIGNLFENNTIGNIFRKNTVEDGINIGNVTGATHIYNNYNTRIFSNSNGIVRLSYFNSSDQLVVTDPTA
jgi:hypothetical protein